VSVSRVGSRPAGASSLRVLTYNIYNTSGGWEQRDPVLATGLRELDADIMGFQETVLDGDWDQVRAIVPDRYHIVHSKHRQPDGFGVSIVSRWPIERVEELDLDVSDRAWNYACTTLIAEIHVPDPIGPMLFVNHFPDYQPDHERERELQTVLAARRLEELAAERDFHVVLVGDLDAEPDAASLRFLAGKQSLDRISVCYRRAWERAHPGERAPTFTQRNGLAAENNWDWPFEEIDHIFVRCGAKNQPTLDITACELAFDEPIDGVWGSDHIAVVADLMRPQARTTP
jgi:endonuclease/exonuclease/phosphatase family metal-dependent hydrolase